MAGVVADRVVVELEARLDRYDANVRQAQRTFGDASNNILGSANKMESTVKRAMGGVAAAIGGVSAIALVRSFLAAADASKAIDSQLRLATRTFGTFGQAQADVERIAADTRNGLQETASLYGNLVRATQSLGGTQNEASRATETFSKALKIGGADTNAAAAATLQFGQALASGVLRGDEFNSIAEASPRILKLISEAMTGPDGVVPNVRKLAEEGKLTSDVLFKALTDRRFTAGIDEEFKTLPVTFGEAMQAVENAATITFGAFDRGGGFSTALANFVTDGADGFTDLEETAVKFGQETRAVIEGLANAWEPFQLGGAAALDALGVKVFSLNEQIISVLGSVDRVNQFGAGFANFLNAPGNALRRARGEAPVTVEASSSVDRFKSGQRRSLARTRLDEGVRRLEGQGFIVPRFADGQVDEANIRRRPTAPTPKRAPVEDKKKKKKGPSAETLARRAEAERLRGLRDDESFEAEKAGLNRDLLRAQRAGVVAVEMLAEFQLQEIEAERKRQNDSYTRDVSEKKLTQARADELVLLNNRVAAERAAAVRAELTEKQRQARQMLTEADLSNARDLAQVEVDMAATAKQRRDASLRLLDLEYEMQKVRLEGIIASRDATAAEKKIARRRLELLPQLQAADRDRVTDQNAGPLARYRQGLDDPATQVEQAVADKLASVDRGITDAISKKLGVKDPFLKQLLSVFIQQQILKPLFDAVAGAASGGGGGGGILGSLIKIGSSALTRRASGGHVMGGTLYQVNEGGGTEGFRPSGSGQIVPLGQMNAPQVMVAGGGGMSLNVEVNAPGANAQTVALIKSTIADAAPAIVQAAARVSSRQLTRKRITA